MRGFRFRKKTVIGAALMLLSLAGVFYWESAGRERALMVRVAASSRDLSAGELLSASDVMELSVPPEAAVSGAMSPEAAASLVGMRAVRAVRAGEQLRGDLFASEVRLLEPGQSIFSVPSAWIYSRPASLCAGDRLRLFTVEGEDLGSYTAAYLRGSSEQALNLPRRGENILSRVSDGMIENIEIVCSPDDFFRILSRTAAHETAVIAGGSYVSSDLRRCLVICVDAEGGPADGAEHEPEKTAEGGGM